MRNLFRNCLYQGKNLFRDFEFSFWSLLYPVILAFFFHMAFSGMLEIELKDINVGIEKESKVAYILEEIEFLNVHEIHKNEIEEKLNKEEIDGFVDKDLSITVKKSGINQTIIKEIVEQIKQMSKLNIPIEKFDFTADYILDKNQEANSVMIIFYSLIAMVSTYGIYAGISAVILTQANLSSVGSRINITPLKKQNFLLAGVIVALLLNLLSNGILLIFLKYVLKIHLFNDVKHSLVLIIFGNLFGISLGLFIGSSNKKSYNIKILMSTVLTLFLSFTSGMMGPHIKLIVDKNIPILSRINPISIISNSLYRINLLNSTKSVGEGILILSLYSIALIFTSYIFLRRRNYDSI